MLYFFPYLQAPMYPSLPELGQSNGARAEQQWGHSPGGQGWFGGPVPSPGAPPLWMCSVLALSSERLCCPQLFALNPSCYSHLLPSLSQDGRFQR